MVVMEILCYRTYIYGTEERKPCVMRASPASKNPVDRTLVKRCRFQVVRETMEGIRAVKSSAWEGFFERKINELREKELYYLKVRATIIVLYQGLVLSPAVVAYVLMLLFRLLWFRSASISTRYVSICGLLLRY